ncbi:hypothetical protein M752DRAFT_338157 [Aspergillus phoenicis ATCC 13157]|uniref:C2H2-type domain-containing protein n=1 Tax=Aspergillus phoenicis ATCC 13157 TaxID=1353007 RepID=A0A370PAM8_ASPPH|nr:hypothetical protein M752DRAFT_338157 [Aspergillus phoenicis ATCC 13157]
MFSPIIRVSIRLHSSLLSSPLSFAPSRVNSQLTFPPQHHNIPSCPPLEQRSYSESSDDSMQSAFGYFDNTMYTMAATDLPMTQPSFEPSSYESTSFTSSVNSSPFNAYYNFTPSLMYSPEAYTFLQTQTPPVPVSGGEWIAPQSTTPSTEVVYSPEETCDALDNSRPVKPFSCRDCGKAFTRPADLKRHHTSVHNPVFQDCPVQECLRKDGNGFPRRDHLIEHLRSFHHWDVPKRRTTKRSRTD